MNKDIMEMYDGSEYFKAHLIYIAGCAANLVNAWEAVSR